MDQSSSARVVCTRGSSMKLYRNSNGVWAGTQADARKMCGKDYTSVDVPVDKPSLLMFLNANKVGSGAISDMQDITSEDTELNRGAMSWIRWSYDRMRRGQYDDAKEMLRKGLELAKTEKQNDA